MSKTSDSVPQDPREKLAQDKAAALGLNRPWFEQGRAMILAGLNEKYTAERIPEIPAQWGRFSPHMCQIAGSHEGTVCYGVSWNVQPGCDFDYLTAVEVPQKGPLPPSFIHLELPARKYAVFGHSEHVSQIGKSMDLIWGKWVQDCGLAVAWAPSFERYTQEFNAETGFGGTELWIPLEA